MSWHNYSAEDRGIPPLWCWAFYFVNPGFNFSPEAFDGAQFKTGLFKDAFSADYRSERFEFYYLPGATPEDCVAHYRAELEKRGTIWEDLERLNQALARREQGQAQEDPHHLNGLPGLVPAYGQDNMMASYKGVIFMSQDADWDPEHSGRRLCHVEHDPIPQYQYYDPEEPIYFDPMEHPVHPEWIGAVQGAAWIDEYRTLNCGNMFQETLGANKEASSIGWNSW